MEILETIIILGVYTVSVIVVHLIDNYYSDQRLKTQLENNREVMKETLVSSHESELKKLKVTLKGDLDKIKTQLERDMDIKKFNLFLEKKSEKFEAVMAMLHEFLENIHNQQKIVFAVNKITDEFVKNNKLSSDSERTLIGLIMYHLEETKLLKFDDIKIEIHQDYINKIQYYINCLHKKVIDDVRETRNNLTVLKRKNIGWTIYAENEEIYKVFDKLEEMPSKLSETFDSKDEDEYFKLRDLYIKRSKQLAKLFREEIQMLK